jgi:hypothetical protein
VTQKIDATKKFSGQAYIEHKSDEALRAWRVNHKNKTNFFHEAIKDLANVESDTMRKYRGRYVFEMLQNANDAILEGKYRLKQQRNVFRVRIHLTEEALIVANDGASFAEKDVDSIYRWGESSKTGKNSSEYKTIGYKGIGFKSVLEITESPQVFSEVVQFHFDRETCDTAIRQIIGKKSKINIPFTRFIFPFSIEQIVGPDQLLIDHLLNHEKYATVIRLPLKQGVSADQILERIKNDVDPALLIFLNGIDEIDIWHCSNRLLLYSRQLVTEKGYQGKVITLYESRKIVSRWLLFESPKVTIKDVSLIDDLQEDAWKSVKQVGFALAFPLDDIGQLKIEETDSGRLFVYFPTEERSGLRYRIHADFYVDASRKSIECQRPYNRWLGEKIAVYLTAKVVPELVHRFPNDKRVVQILTPVNQPFDISEVIFSAITEKLGDCVFIPTQDGKLTSPHQTLLAPQPVWSELTQFHSFFLYSDLSRRNAAKKNFIHEELYQDPEVVQFIRKLGGEIVLTSDVFALLDGRDPTSGRKDYLEFYHLLKTWHDNLVEEETDKNNPPPSWRLNQLKNNFCRSLSQSCCIIGANGRWIKPHTRVYHPKFRQETADMPDFLSVQIVAPTVYGDGERKSSAYFVLNQLIPPVRDYDASEIITSAIMPLFEQDKFKFQDMDVSERAQIYRYLFEYWCANGDKNRNINEMIGNVKVFSRPIANRSQQIWKPIRDVYLSKQWTGDPYLEQLYDEFEEIFFLYGIREIDVDENDRPKWCEFLQWMGAHASPRILVHEHKYNNWRAITNVHPHHGTKLWDLYTQFIERNYGTCPDHGKSSRILGKSITLEAIDRVIETQDQKRLEALFKLLVKNWDRLKSAIENKASVECVRRSGRYCRVNNKSCYVPNFVKFLLTESNWIPARTITDGKSTTKLIKPYSCWFIPPGEDPIVRNMLSSPLLNIDTSDYQRFCQDIGMHFLQNASLNDLVQVLKDLPINFPDPTITIQIGRRPYPRAVSTMTRWVLERINNILIQSQQKITPLPLKERFPLVGSKGELVLYVLPTDLIFFADDRIHAPRWKGDVPFAPLDDNWRDVADYLGIHCISKNVSETIVPGHNLMDKSATLMKRFTNARPYMLAVFENQRGSKTEETARYLMNLEIQVVDNLVVERSLTIGSGFTVPDDKAKIYLQDRVTERIGSGGRAPKAGTLYVQNGYQEYFDIMGEPIAHYLGIPGLSDAFVILLDRGDKNGRMKYIQMRGISEERVEEMRTLLGQNGNELTEIEEIKPGIPAKLPISLISGIKPHSVDHDEGGEPHMHPGTTTPPIPLSEGNDDVEPISHREIKFPPLELEGIVPVIVTGGKIRERISTVGGGHHGGSGGNWEQDHILNQAYGQRGEEIVYYQEIERLRKRGLENPEQHVLWLHRLNQPAANHDFESKDLIDGEWSTIYIEVKSTPGSDFRFEMSRGELNFADQHGIYYQLHRVIHVASSRPQVFIFENPLTLYRQENAWIDMRDTYVTLPNPLRQEDSQISNPNI